MNHLAVQTSLTDVPDYVSAPLPNLPGAHEGDQDGAVLAPQAEPSEKEKAKEAKAPGKPDEKPAIAPVSVAPDQGGDSADEKRSAPLEGVAATSQKALEEEAEEVAAKLRALPSDASSEDKANAVGTRPAGLDGPRDGAADDLTRIKGIGKINEDRLNLFGVYHFDQIAAWGRPEVRWVTTYLAFPGRIDREDWLGQAQTLAQGGDTEFSKRVDAGDVYDKDET